MEGSYAETDWKKGSKARFLSPEGGGMVSRIAEHKPNEYLEIEHRGIVTKTGEEDTESPDAKTWQGLRETYRVERRDGNTELVIEMESPEDWIEYFTKSWKEALEKVKELAEK